MLVKGLDTLSHDRQIEAAAQPDYGSYNRSGADIRFHAGDEAAVNLDLVERKTLEIAER